MKRTTWQDFTLIERVHWLRYLLPPLLAIVVVLYQLQVARRLAENFGHPIHYAVEIVFYSIVGPAVSWITLAWVERRLVEQQRLERQVQARTQQLASLTAASADAILSLDIQGRVASWNHGAEQMFGYPATAVLSQPLSLFLPEADRLNQEKGVQSFETSARTRDGRRLTVELTQTRLTATDEEMPVNLIIIRDVTARREREAVLEEERARIARDLHDGVAQTLYFLALKADLARQQMGQNPEGAAADLQEVGQKARQVIREVRRTIFALRPLGWKNGGFLSALNRFIAGFAEQVGWQTELEIADDCPIPQRLEPVIYRLVQESLNNVAKHAQATLVSLRLCPAEDRRSLILTVRDNGQGFDPETENGSGLGLSQMEARVTAVGGDFQLHSQHQAGTTITAKLPLPGESHE
ncbi:MAG: histidine kinase [Anaerolineae bacterium]